MKGKEERPTEEYSKEAHTPSSSDTMPDVKSPADSSSLSHLEAPLVNSRKRYSNPLAVRAFQN